MRYLFILFLWIATASADVIVYKGTSRARLDAATQFSRVPRLYFVVDLAAKTGNLIFYYRLNGSKQSTPFPAFGTTRYNGEAISAVARIGTFTAVLDNDIGGGEFGAFMLYLRGKEATLTLSNNGVPTIGNFPKVLTGIFREAQFVSNTPTNFEFNLTLTFDAIHTQSANNAFKNGATTVNDLAAELDALGY